MFAAPKQRRRTVFDLTPQELADLRKLNLQVIASVLLPMPEGYAEALAACKT